MARSYANVATAIWRDDEFRALSISAQHLYFLLISQPDISAAGVLSLNLTRWASRTAGITRSRLRGPLEELQEHRFIVVDEDTEELLVRSFVRWDNGYGNSNRQPSIRDAADAIESTTLRRALAREFDRLDVPRKCIPDSFSQVEGPPDGDPDGHPHGHPDGDPGGDPGFGRVVVTTGPYLEPTTHNPQSTTRVPSPAPPETPRVRASKRAGRIPDDFTLTEELAQWGRENAPNVNGAYETAKFIDYWRAKSGRDATKKDWVATWRNWIRKANESLPSNVVAISGRRPSTTDQRVQAGLDLAAKYAAEETS